MLMWLTREEERILGGEKGFAAQKAMEILVALGDIFGADRLIPVGSVQVSGVSYKTIGDEGLEWLESLQGGKAVVEATLNPAGMDLERWEEMGVPKGFADRQLRIIAAFQSMGIQPLCTCTPYLLGNLPRFGEHLAWSESSAVCFANSVLGARTNREGGPSAIASALVGKTPRFGYHLPENRRPALSIDVPISLKDGFDFSLLGYVIGLEAKNRVPFIESMGRYGYIICRDELKALSASLAASGSVALFHMEGVTPEASMAKKSLRLWIKEVERLSIEREDLERAREKLSTASEDEVDLVAFGCPHASLEELRLIAGLLRGKSLKRRVRLWIFTSLGIRRIAERCGYIHAIEAAGGRIYADTCMVVAPLEKMGFEAIAVNSAKAAVYLSALNKPKVILASTEECISMATKR
ncbi:MAG: aconitase X catalytic domain-containing protein [Candidatus Bathyarchaeia archaeon]